jgi:hypothetical protein
MMSEIIHNHDFLPSPSAWTYLTASTNEWPTADRSLLGFRTIPPPSPLTPLPPDGNGKALSATAELAGSSFSPISVAGIVAVSPGRPNPTRNSRSLRSHCCRGSRTRQRSEMSKDWAVEPLDSYQNILNLLRITTTHTRLVQSALPSRDSAKLELHDRTESVKLFLRGLSAWANKRETTGRQGVPVRNGKNTRF